MRRMVLAVAVVIIVCLAVSTILVAQGKGKPAPPPTPTYVWSATLPTYSSTASIYGWQDQNGKAVPYVNGQNGLAVSAAAGTCDGCIISGFKLSIQAPSNLANLPWIGFRNLYLYGFDHDVSYMVPPYPPAAACKYPSFLPSGFLQLGGYAPPAAGLDCVLDFISHQHPQYPYDTVNLTIHGKDFDAFSMMIGASVYPPQSDIELQIVGPDCKTSNQYSGVYTQFRYNAGRILITRNTADQWTLDLQAQPLGVMEQVQATAKKACGSTTAGYVRALGLNGTFVWARTLVTQ